MTGPFTQPLVYFFGQGRADGTAAMKDVLGGKGAGLAEMTTLGIPVPPGFTIATSVCHSYLESRQLPPGSAARSSSTCSTSRPPPASSSVAPSIRCWSRSARERAVSMPGMMETILNLGLNETTVEGLAAQAGNPSFACDSYRRFVQMYGERGVRSPEASLRAAARRRASRSAESPATSICRFRRAAGGGAANSRTWSSSKRASRFPTIR